MKRLLFIFLLFLTILSGCKKAETIPTSGTDTIDNTGYQNATTYYALGFSFSQAKKISNLSQPGPDITLIVNQDNPASTRLTLMVDNFKRSYFKIGDFTNEVSSVAAFNNLKTVGTYQWVDLADTIKANQVWLYRTGRDQYAKFRIVSAKNEVRNSKPYGECTFQWVFQPDGSSTFPGK
jgi:hypothetical protein